MKLTAGSPRPAPKRGRPLKTHVAVFTGRARFAEGCRICERLKDEYNCVMPYHEPAETCLLDHQPHCTCEECW